MGCKINMNKLSIKQRQKDKPTKRQISQQTHRRAEGKITRKIKAQTNIHTKFS